MLISLIFIVFMLIFLFEGHENGLSSKIRKSSQFFHIIHNAELKEIFDFDFLMEPRSYRFI